MPSRIVEPLPPLSVHPLTPERWTDLERLFGKRGAYGGCWCMWWRLPRSEFSRQSDEEKRQGLKAIAESGQVPGLLGYVDDAPVAWCSIGPRETYPALERSRTLKRIDDRPVWSIVCFFVARTHRRRGLMVPLIEAAVEYARARGARIVEAYPVEVPEAGLSSASAYTGLVSAFEAAGFVEVARPSKHRRIMRYLLDAHFQES